MVGTPRTYKYTINHGIVLKKPGKPKPPGTKQARNSQSINPGILKIFAEAKKNGLKPRQIKEAIKKEIDKQRRNNEIDKLKDKGVIRKSRK